MNGNPIDSWLEKDCFYIENFLCENGRIRGKNKKVGSITYLFSLKLTNLTKPKLMKKNVIQM